MSNEVLRAATWDDVAPLLARYQIALVPYLDGTWDVRVFGAAHRAQHVVASVAFAALPEAIRLVAARCAAAAWEEAG